MEWMCSPEYTAPFPLLVASFIIFTWLGFVLGTLATFFSAYDWETKYKKWKKDNGYE